MSQQPFTSEGAALLISELYSLPQQQLQLQADAAKANLRSWLQNHFVLDANQVSYINAIDNAWIDYTGNQLWLALSNRLPVELIKPDAIDPNDFSAKIILSDSEIDVTYNSLTGIQVTGTLTIHISIP